MRDFLCRTCGQRLSFENSLCLHCRSALGFWLPTRSLAVLDGKAQTVKGGRLLERCANNILAQCNWLVEWSGTPQLCASCRLTRTRPGDHDMVGLAAFGQAESAKRRVILELAELGLPITGRSTDRTRGLAFDLLSSAQAPVSTGHLNGVVTLDLAEDDDVHRERTRVRMSEPYRTVLGHFRHELGHYYQMVLVDRAGERPRAVGSGPARHTARHAAPVGSAHAGGVPAGLPGHRADASSGEFAEVSPAARFADVFGDPSIDYARALARHHSHGAPRGWAATYVSSYATMHPAEDFAETFAHYLHIRDTLDTAAAFAMAPAGSRLDAALAGDTGFDQLVEWWLPLTWALNQLNRSMGHSDLYPFVLTGPVLEKMRFVHNLVAPPA